MFKKIKGFYDEAGIRAYAGMKAAKCYAVNFERGAREHIKGDNKAQGILEYGLIIALVSVGVIVAVMTLRNTIMERLSKASNDIATAQ